MVKPFKIGALTEDDLDQDYAPGRSEETMSGEHRASLDRLAARIRRRAAQVKKHEQIVIVLEPE
jgi:hypothetical protein